MRRQGLVWDLFLIFLAVFYFEPTKTYSRWRDGCYCDYWWGRLPGFCKSDFYYE